MRITIRAKIASCIAIGIFAVAVGAILLARQAVSRGFTDEMLKMSYTITHYLAEKMVTPLLTNDLPGINLIIYHIKQENRNNIEYIFLTDQEGQVMASTLGNASALKIARLNPIPATAEFSTKHFHTKQTGIYDVANRLLKSDIGELHIGFSDKGLHAALNNFSKRFILIISLVCLIGLGLAIYVAKHITGPLENLARKMQQVRQGNLAVSIDKLPNDEIGLLGQTFNYMIGDLEEKTQRLKKTNEDLNYIVNEIQRVLEDAVIKQSFKVRFHNPGLAKCWEVKQCNSTKCPSYESEDQRCWHVAGTFCKGEVQGTFAQKLGDCRKCEVYQQALTVKLYAIGEVFNDMMEILEEKNQEVKDYAQNLEDRVKERTTDLEQANQELKSSQEQLLQSGKLAAIGQLTAGVSHELNNPLGGILGYSQFILEKAQRKDGPENLGPEELKNIFTYVGYIERESQRCKSIVANLLKFSRASKTETVPLDINQVLEETFIFTQHQLEIHQLELVRKFASNLPPVIGNEHQLQQVFTNLMINAQQAMKKGSKLTVSTVINDGLVEIAFADTGCGIPKEHLDKLFDPFFTTKEAGEGTGLGLSVSYGIIQAHHGRIEVKSKVGKGTTFRIKLPVEPAKKEGGITG